MNRKLEQFILENTTPEDPVLEDLYRQTHIRFVNPNMSTGHIQGKLLEFISMMIKPFNILEIGTFTGYSAICLSKGLQDGGRLLTIEINDELADFARSYFVKAGVEEKIVQVTGKAQEIIPGLDYMFDLAFIDGDKREYCEYFRAVFEKVRPGGFILADNVLWGGQAMDKETTDPQANGIIDFNEMIRNQENIDKLMLPVRDGLTVIRKKQ
jgi:predicted O-methyltransferase YrrM